MRAQTIRAILLARATVTSMRGLRTSMRPSHEPSGAPRRAAWRTTALAPMIKRRRKVRSPIFDVAPILCSLLLIAEAVSNPARQQNPAFCEGGRVRRQCDQSRCRDRSNTRDRAQSAHVLVLASPPRDLRVKQRDLAPEQVRGSLGDGIPILGKVAAQRVDRLNPLTRIRRSHARDTTALACCSALFTATNSIVGRCAASQIASASAASFFCRFTNGFT